MTGKPYKDFTLSPEFSPRFSDELNYQKVSKIFEHLVIHHTNFITANQETVVELISFTRRVMSQFEFNQKYSQLGKTLDTLVVLVEALKSSFTFTLKFVVEISAICDVVAVKLLMYTL